MSDLNALPDNDDNPKPDLVPESPEDAYLSMSDEDILKLAVQPMPLEPEPAPEPVPEPQPAMPTEPAPVAAPAEPVEPQPAAPAAAPKAAEDGKPAQPAVPAEAADAIDYKAAYEKLTAPFKANGREIAVKDVDDAITLMQMGANYNKKMAALKPNLKLMKLLENNGLLSEEKLSFLIDLDKKNPEAINKLVKDAGIDPMDFDADKASTYKQPAYTVDDREVELDTVLEELQDSPTYTRTLDVVSNKWDSNSKQAIAAAPQLLKVINDHMQNGVYDVVSAEMENERMLGRLQGMSDLDAYRYVGDKIHARGGFAHLFGAAAQPAASAPAQPAAPAVIVPPQPQQDEDDALKNKRRAASPVRPTAPGASAVADFNPLALSDEEFAKQVNSRFL